MFKGLNTYQQLQISIVVVLFIAWVYTGVICILYPDPSDFIVNLYGKLEAVFLTLASLKTLEAKISETNGGGKDAKSSDGSTTDVVSN